MSEGGQIWPRLKPVATEVGLLDNLRAVTTAARAARIRVFIVPHRRWQPGDYDDWAYPNPTQVRIQESHTFAKGTWGGEFHPDFTPRDGDVVIKEHWAQSGFANTDLDFQPKQHGITHVIVIGVLANTCVESTSRFDYRTGDLVTALKHACLNGIDVYFDNVGGDILKAVLRQINPGARIPLCGIISQYNATELPAGPNLAPVLVNRALIQGFIISDHVERMPEFLRECGEWVRTGRESKNAIRHRTPAYAGAP